MDNKYTVIKIINEDNNYYASQLQNELNKGWIIDRVDVCKNFIIYILVWTHNHV